MDIKGEINSYTIIVLDFNIPLTSTYRSCRQIINREALAPNDTLDQMHLIYIENSIPSSRIHILFKCTWNILQYRSHARPQNKPWKI